MPKLQHTGEREFRGLDPDAEVQRDIRIAPGETVEVSDAMAEALLRDFPGRFKKAGAKAAATEKDGA